MSRSTTDIFEGLLAEVDPRSPLPAAGLLWHSVTEYDGVEVRILCLAANAAPPVGARLLTDLAAGDSFEGPIRLGERAVEGEAVVVSVIGATVRVRIERGDNNDTTELVRAVRLAGGAGCYR